MVGKWGGGLKHHVDVMFTVPCLSLAGPQTRLGDKQSEPPSTFTPLHTLIYFQPDDLAHHDRRRRLPRRRYRPHCLPTHTPQWCRHPQPSRQGMLMFVAQLTAGGDGGGPDRRAPRTAPSAVVSTMGTGRLGRGVDRCVLCVCVCVVGVRRDMAALVSVLTGEATFK